MDSMAQPDMVTSLTEFFRRYGGFRADSFLAYAVRAFYENGGRRLYIVRVAPPNKLPTPNPNNIVASAAASAKIDSLAISAANEGDWGNRIWIRITDSSDGDAKRFKLHVLYGTSKEDTKPVLVESYDNLEFITAGSPIPANYARTIINGRSEYIAITEPLTKRPPNNAAVDPKDPFGPFKPDNPKQLEKGLDGSWGNGGVDYIGAVALSSDVTGTGLHALEQGDRCQHYRDSWTRRPKDNQCRDIIL